MYYVYVLHSNSTDRYYIGYTHDLKQRFSQHNQALNIATKSGVPWDLVYYEAYPTKASATERERKLKHHGKGLAEIKKRISFC